jgi:hypothetical protein
MFPARTCGANLVPQVFPFILGELKQEIFREAIAIAFRRAIQRFGFNAVDRRQIGV